MNFPPILAAWLAGFLALVPPLQAAELPRLVILPFENHSGRSALDPLREGIADLLTACFAPLSDRVVVLDRSQLAGLLAEQGLGFEGLVAEAGRQRQGQLKGASHLLRGSFVAPARGLVVQGELYDLTSTQLLSTIETHSPEGALVASLCEGFAVKLSAGLSHAVGSHPSLRGDVDPLHSQLMIAGIGHYTNGQLSDAFPAFLKILRARPDDEAARYWLARSFHEAGLDGLALAELKEYLARHPDSGRRAEVEALRNEIEQDGHD